ncbi:MAG: tyrosine-type recombinase/integrase [Rudaea sp.]
MPRGAYAQQIEQDFENRLEGNRWHERRALSTFRFHDLGHTFESKLVMAGFDLNTVRELLGHADIRMTLRYAQLAAEHKAAAVEKLVR